MTCVSDSIYKNTIIELFENHHELNENFLNVYFYNHSRKNDVLKFVQLITKSYSADVIILHGFYGGLFTKLFLLWPGVSRKTYWVVWGGDLYFRSTSSSSQRIAHNLDHILRKQIIKNFRGILTSLPQDYHRVQETYHTNAPHIVVFYPNPVNFNILDQNSELQSKKHIKKILLGNSASPTNNHFEAIDYLAAISKDINFQVICPLSYGENKTAVIEYGKEKLGEKFFPLLEFIEPSEYAKILVSIDVAIMNHSRQEAVSTILALLYSGKKVFIRKQVSTYPWLKDLGINIFNTTDLLSSTTNIDLFDFTEEKRMENMHIISNYFSDEHCIKMWKEVFDR